MSGCLVVLIAIIKKSKTGGGRVCVSETSLLTCLLAYFLTYFLSYLLTRLALVVLAVGILAVPT